MNGRFYLFSRTITRIYFKLYHRASFGNCSVIPDDGPLIIASNHTSHLDPPLLASVLSNRPITFMAKKQLFENRFFRHLISNLGAFPVDRDSAGDKKSFVETIRLLKEGRAVVIFPEGTRSETGDLQEFQSGVARLSLSVPNCKILPVRIRGSYESMGGGKVFPRPCKILVNVGEPLDPSDFDSIVDKKERSNKIIQKLRDEIISL